MGDRHEWTHLRQRAAGKWQIPLLLVSAALLGLALLRRDQDAPRFSLDDQLHQLAEWIGAGEFDPALSLAQRVLLRPELTDADRGVLHVQLARARYGSSSQRSNVSPTAGRFVLQDYERAVALGAALDGGDFARIGEAHEWQGQHLAAADQYEAALARGIKDAPAVRQKLFFLLRDSLDAAPHRLDAVLSDNLSAATEGTGLDPKWLLWTLEQKLELLEETGQCEDAPGLLERFAGFLGESEFQDRFNYLEALSLFLTSRTGEAATMLRYLRNRVEPWDDLHAMTGWLLGRVLLAEEGEDPRRVEEAASFLRDVITQHPRHPYALASMIGLGEALAHEGRHEEALDILADAATQFPSLERECPVRRAEFRTLLSVLSETQRQSGSLLPAIRYARQALSLLESGNEHQESILLHRLAQLQGLYAENNDSSSANAGYRLPASPEVQALYAEAAESYLQLATIAPDDRQSGEAVRRAAELLARAGQAQRAVEFFLVFAGQYPADPFVARALLQVGRLREQMGRLAGAVEAYEECYRRFPRSLEAGRTLVPTARCYFFMGPEFTGDAERTLRVVLDDPDVFTPQAPEFTDALFLWGELLHDRGEMERAIATLEEALDRYPDDPRVVTARFLLADSYRRSALQLRNRFGGSGSGNEWEQTRDEVSSRFQRARELYRSVIDQWDSGDPAALGRPERVYRRLASLHEADCWFENQEYLSALKRYEELAASLGEGPELLGAYVQIINCHVFLGQSEEARSALGRALVLVDALPADAFEHDGSPQTRADWKRYFEWLQESALF